MERFEIRVCDGFGTFTSVFKTAQNMAEAQQDCDNLHGQMTRMGVSVGRIELRGEDDKLAEVWTFTAAMDRVVAKRQQARREAFKRKMHAAGLDNEDDRL